LKTLGQIGPRAVGERVKEDYFDFGQKIVYCNPIACNKNMKKHPGYKFSLFIAGVVDTSLQIFSLIFVII
jgi:hypothetical protein